MTSYANACRSCGEPIRWEKTARSRPSPVSIRTGLSHFIDCPHKRQWRKQRPKPEAAPAAAEQLALVPEDPDR